MDGTERICPLDGSPAPVPLDAVANPSVVSILLCEWRRTLTSITHYM